jgi:hypothetical protein
MAIISTYFHILHFIPMYILLSSFVNNMQAHNFLNYLKCNKLAEPSK